MRDQKAKAIVLRRTNYGEADRILQLLTEEGKVSVLAKSVRKERSRLAGSIELFSLSEVTIHHGKSELGILTSARLIEFYGTICSDLDLMEFAGSCLRDVSRRTEHIDSPEFFDILAQTLKALSNNSKQIDLIRTWWLLNLSRISGEDANFHIDTKGDKLSPDQTYAWNSAESSLEPNSANGRITVNHIKLIRLMLSAPLKLILKIQNTTHLIDDTLYIAKCINQS
ncbi:MAG: DNA repair protein RecO [Candidatus Nomurabacteria bacterium]|jgi:DNA repair protein RecO (recombination protein O)|nr:DNA repair protein RecO [Candidatus Nomurabacteria bacterium]